MSLETGVMVVVLVPVVSPAAIVIAAGSVASQKEDFNATPILFQMPYLRH